MDELNASFSSFSYRFIIVSCSYSLFVRSGDRQLKIRPAGRRQALLGKVGVKNLEIFCTTEYSQIFLHTSLAFLPR